MIKQKRWLLSTLGLLLVVIVVFMFIRERGGNNGGYVGKIWHMDCSTAGVGCTDYILELDNGNSYGISNSSINLSRYNGKRVRVNGELINPHDNAVYLVVHSVKTQ